MRKRGLACTVDGFTRCRILVNLARRSAALVPLKGSLYEDVRATRAWKVETAGSGKTGGFIITQSCRPLGSVMASATPNCVCKASVCVSVQLPAPTPTATKDPSVQDFHRACKISTFTITRKYVSDTRDVCRIPVEQTHRTPTKTSHSAYINHAYVNNTGKQIRTWLGILGIGVMAAEAVEPPVEAHKSSPASVACCHAVQAVH